MTKEELLLTAKSLRQPSPEAVREYEEKRELLAAGMTRLMSARPDIIQLVGKENLAMMEDNHRNHARFMSSLFLNYQPQVLVETVLWVFRAYRSHGFRLTYWPALLDQCVELLREHLPPDAFSEIYPFYNWMIVHQPSFVMQSESEAEAGKDHT